MVRRLFDAPSVNELLVMIPPVPVQMNILKGHASRNYLHNAIIIDASRNYSTIKLHNAILLFFVSSM